MGWTLEQIEDCEPELDWGAPELLGSGSAALVCEHCDRPFRFLFHAIDSAGDRKIVSAECCRDACGGWYPSPAELAVAARALAKHLDSVRLTSVQELAAHIVDRVLGNPLAIQPGTSLEDVVREADESVFPLSPLGAEVRRRAVYLLNLALCGGRARAAV